MAHVVGPEQSDLVLKAMVPVVQEVPEQHGQPERTAAAADVGDPSAEQGAIKSAEQRQRGESEGNVANEHEEARRSVLALIADRNERVGRQLGARQGRVIGGVEVVDGALGCHSPQQHRLSDHGRDEERQGQLVDWIEGLQTLPHDDQLTA